jgi:hypothetical protein
VSQGEEPTRSSLEWTDHGNGFWTTTGPTGTHWEIRDFGSAGPKRFGITVEHWDNPDWSASTLEDAKTLTAEVDARPPIQESEQISDRTVVTPEPGDEYVAYQTATPAPVGPCSCGAKQRAEAVKPQRGSPEWWDDPSAYWRCPDCGRHRGDVAV